MCERERLQTVDFRGWRWGGRGVGFIRVGVEMVKDGGRGECSK